MLLNRNEQAQVEGLFTPETLTKAHAWDGKYGTKTQKWYARVFDQWCVSSQSLDATRVIDVSTYRLGISGPPDWRSRILEHKDATTPFAATLIEMKGHRAASYSYELIPGVYPGQTVAYGIWDPAVYADPQYAPAWQADHDAAVDEQARLAFYSKMASAFDGATFLGEARETIAMLRQPLKRLHDSAGKQIQRSRKLRQKVVRDTKRKIRQESKGLKFKPSKITVNRRVLREWRKAASESYLTWAWGVKPLMHDVADFFTVLKQQLDQPGIEQFAAGSGLTWTKAVVPPRILGSYSTICDASIDILAKTAVVYRGAVFSRIDTTANLSATLKTAPLDWVPTAYELMPYSWLVDYFTTVGDVVNAFVTAQRLRYVFCNKTVRHWTQYDIKLSPRMNYNSIYPRQLKWEIYQPGRLVCRKKHVSRNAVGSVPLPSLSWSGPLSTGKVANLTAFAGLGRESTTFRNRNRL